MKTIFGIDIGGTQIKFGAFNEQCELMEKWSIGTDISESGKHIIPSIEEEIHRYAAVHRMENTDICGIGMGIPGPVDQDGFVRICVNLNWHQFNPVEELKKKFPDVSIAAENDANVAALGEYYQGAGKEYSSAMLITIGTGIGGGIILGGKILSGAHGIAGEIGHITTDSGAKERCNCGNLGCVDHIASASGIARTMRELLKEKTDSCILRETEDITAKDICDAAGKGDLLALGCLDRCMEPLARGMAFFSHAFDPEVFIIGGGVSAAGDLILRPLKKFYRENLYLIEKGADIRVASLGNDAGIIGTCMLAMQEAARKSA